MKRSAKLAIALSVILLFSAGIGLKFACAQTIGHIDVTRIFLEYKEAQKIQEEINKEKTKLEVEFEKEKKKSEDKLKKSLEEGKSLEEFEKLKAELENELNEEFAPKEKELETLIEQRTTELQKKILEATEKVAKKVGIDIVLDKQIFIIGGVDLTDMVLNELNK